MGFFKDFKRDFAQAVNELMPDKDELANEYDDEDMVNTFDDNDDIEVAPEDMLEDLDDFSLSNKQSEDKYEKEMEVERPEADYEDDEEKQEEDAFGNIPEAEIIPEQTDRDVNNLNEDGELVHEMVSGLINSEEPDVKVVDESYIPKDLQDELESLDELDEENMLENTEDAREVEPEGVSDELEDVDLDKAVEDALLRQEENIDSDKEDNMAELDVQTVVDDSTFDKESDMNEAFTDDTTYITKGTVIKGSIEADGGIDVIGTVEGDVICGGKLIVGGTIKGNVTAGEVYANAAKIEGEVLSEGSVKVGVGSVVVGNVSATSAVIAGAINGDIDVHGPVIVDSTAVIMGNIKSRSVQINNGAVIEGFCSQCYSEIDVKSFFE